MDALRVRGAVELDLSQGRHAASARIEWLDADVRIALGGWLDCAGAERLRETLDELADRGMRHLRLDCSRVRHVELRAVGMLTGALSRFVSGGLRLRGLSPHLRDLFRIAGCGEFVPTGFASALLAALPDERPRREWAT